MNTLWVVDHRGNALQLTGTNKGGGEGTIYVVNGNSEECAKIYHTHKITPELHAKLLAMVHNPPDDPVWLKHKRRSIAWPTSVLYKDASQTEFLGFTMPVIDTTAYKESHHYYDSADRLRGLGGEFTWAYLLTTASNIASVVAALHEKGHRVGDLRETNILVAPNALVAFIDCDSFQVRDKTTGQSFPTRVGTGEYLPPELLKPGTNFAANNYDRYYSDLFALGIIIFKFLMNGYHPYQARGRPVDNAPSTMDKIKKGYFAYSNRFSGVSPPDGAWPYATIPPSIQALLERCFVDGHSSPEKRPDAKTWYMSLLNEMKNIKTCAGNKNHIYAQHLSSCPWCALIQKGKSDMFPENRHINNIIKRRAKTASKSNLQQNIQNFPGGTTQPPLWAQYQHTPLAQQTSPAPSQWINRVNQVSFISLLYQNEKVLKIFLIGILGAIVGYWVAMTIGALLFGGLFGFVVVLFIQGVTDFRKFGLSPAIVGGLIGAMVCDGLATALNKWSIIGGSAFIGIVCGLIAGIALGHYRYY